MHPTRSRRTRVALSSLIAILALGVMGLVGAVGAQPAAAEDQEPLTIGIWSGDGQVTTPGRQFAEPLLVRTQGSDIGVGATVVFLVDGPNAVFVNEDGQQLTGVSVAIDVNGFATSPPLLAGDATGSFSVEAQVSGTTTSNAVLFQLSIDPLAPTSMTVVSGGGQTALPGDRFVLPMVVVVFDQLGDPVAGASVTFTIPPGPATFANGDLAAAATTGADGSAVSPAIVAGPSPGDGSILASAEGGSSPSVTIDLQVVPLILSAGEVDAGTAVHVSSAGFASGEPVEARLDGVPVTDVSADADGRIELDLVVPGAAIAGPHLLELVGETSGSRSAPLLVRVATSNDASDSPSGAAVHGESGLAATGAEVSELAPVAAAVCFAAGVAAVVGSAAGRRRRERGLRRR